MRTARVDLDLIIICLGLTDLLLHRGLGLQDLAFAHDDISIANGHAVRDLELGDGIDDHVGRLETGRMATELGVDEALAIPTFGRRGLGAQFGAAVAAPAEARDAELGAGGQVGAHGARKGEDVRVRACRAGAVHEGAHGHDGGEDGADAAQLAPEVGPGDWGGDVVHRVHEGDRSGAAGDDVWDDHFLKFGPEIVSDDGPVVVRARVMVNFWDRS